MTEERQDIQVKPEHFVLDRNNLEQAILNQASWFDLYASECSRQQNRVDRLKNSLEYKSAQKKIEIRANADAKGKKMTQDQVDCEISVDEEIQCIKNQILDEEEYLGQLKSAVEAMRHKRDSIGYEVDLVRSKASMILDGAVDADTRFQVQLDAVDRATQESMNRQV